MKSRLLSNSPRCELYTEEIKFKQVQKLNYLRSVVTADNERKNPKRRRDSKNVFQKLNNILRNKIL